MRAARLFILITAIIEVAWIVDIVAPSYVGNAIYNPKLLPEWFIIGAGAAIVVLFPVLLRSDVHRLTLLGYALFSAGAIANVSMRMLLGPVPDFIPFPWHPATQCNLADLALFTGILLTFFSVLFLEDDGEVAPLSR